MKPIIKKGNKHIFNIWMDTTCLCINLNNRWVYVDSRFKHNTLTITTKDGEIEIRFSGYVEKCEFDYEEKDQLFFKIKDNFE